MSLSPFPFFLFHPQYFQEAFEGFFEVGRLHIPCRHVAQLFQFNSPDDDIHMPSDRLPFEL